ncbi:MAG: Glu/Leu/Phe/Val dehydrogenase dimerization domain-containing protein [Flavobacteriales bacterium]|nr:Glu/Leu/Phe/Val dehydrogenase dimerization domain-containing protein [Flavobacteriales bacterium]
MIESLEKAAVITSPASSITERMSAANHEQVVFCQDIHTGLRAIIAIHNTTLGPAVGGTRMWTYSSEADALTDVLRLSRGMTYKSAVAGLNIGGGKAVIIGNARTQKTEALMRRFGKFVDGLAGRYITAEDVGMSTRDMEYVKMATDHVVGLPDYLGGGGDPSPVTAMGVYMGMKAAVKELTGNDSLSGKKIMVQGIGHVGEYLVAHLVKEGAVVKVSDIYEDRLKKISNEYKVEVVDVNNVYSQDVDVYSPCALGATVNDDTIAQLQCSIICGAANNQLKTESIHGQALFEKGILYAPDFVVNAGGIINCYWEIIGYHRNAALAQAEKIFDTTSHIFAKSKLEHIPTYLAANRIAEERIEAVGKVKMPF